MKPTGTSLEDIGCTEMAFYYVVVFRSDTIELDTASRDIDVALLTLRKLTKHTMRARLVRMSSSTSWSEAIVSPNGKRVLEWASWTPWPVSTTNWPWR